MEYVYYFKTGGMTQEKLDSAIDRIEEFRTFLKYFCDKSSRLLNVHQKMMDEYSKTGSIEDLTQVDLMLTASDLEQFTKYVNKELE